MKSNEIDAERREFLKIATTIMGTIGIAAAGFPFIMALEPSTDVEAIGAPVSVDLSKIKPGEMITIPWRGKPIWVVRRTQEQLKSLSLDESLLRDPNSKVDQQPEYAKNRYRSIKPEFLVLVGVCTHLGCIPNYKPELGSISPQWPGGFLCPCHGSKFDMAGRVFKGVPAPVNLEVPKYAYRSDTEIIIGTDTV